jgi:hypothetical protein
MISEYALDPELVARWHDPREWAFFREAFADGTGRFGSTFPRQNVKKWRQAVLSTFRQCFPTETPQSRAWQRMDALLERLSERMVEREPGDAPDGRWLDRAVAEHRRRPFQGILSSVPATGVAEVLTPEMLFDDRPTVSWAAPRCPPVPRTAADFADVLRPLLLRCREVVFVDPWFDPNKPEFTDPLRTMLEVLWGPGRGVDAPSAQLVIAEGGNQGKRDARWLVDVCSKRLPRILPAGRCLTVTVLRQRPGGQKIHNRYVLTIFCGVSFGTGLDAAGDEGSGQTDDLCRLTREQLDARWGQYVSARGSWFEEAAGPAVIRATR